MRFAVLASSVVAIALASQTAAAQSGVRSVQLGRRLNDRPNALKGFVDLHTHPMSHLAFGGKIFHGAPDVGTLMPRDMRGCGTPEGPARSKDEALAPCDATHKAVANGCGDVLRNLAVRQLESKAGAQREHGARGPESWPAYDDITHQGMWIDWLERAYQGGLRVMVALVTNNQMLGDSANGVGTDDVTVAERAIPEMRRLVERHPWMEIAKSPADVRRIVGQDKMAVVLGVELDDLGLLTKKQRSGAEVTDAEVRAAVRRLHAMDVRYAFPVHVVDNIYGGTALYKDPFDMANRYLAGHWWGMTCKQGLQFSHRIGLGVELGAWAKLKMDPAEHPFVPVCRPGEGHANRRGLTRRGAIAMDEMMRLGMLIDVDHMSHETLDDAITVARGFQGGYPLVSGHSRLLDEELASPDPAKDERREDKKLARHYAAIRELGGMVGVENDDVEAGRWTKEAGLVMAYAGNAIALGTDINGLLVQFRPPDCHRPGAPAAHAQQRECTPSRLPQSQAGTEGKRYARDGMAHYGILPDVLEDVAGVRDVEVRPRPSVAADRATPLAPGARSRIDGADVIDALYAGAESFAKTWERAASKASSAAVLVGPVVWTANIVEVPPVTIGPLCPSLRRGDRELGGGPAFATDVKLRIVDSTQTAGMRRLPSAGSGPFALVANVHMRASEVGGDTEAEQRWDVVVATSPPGMRYARILGAPAAESSQLVGHGSRGGRQLLRDRTEAKMRFTPDTGSAVDEFVVVGDTPGPDIARTEDCTEGTSVTVRLNPVRLVLESADVPFDAVDVLIQTGRDDVRGGPGSAMVSFELAGGVATPEVDVTSLGKGAGRSGVVRVPLGRVVRRSELRALRLRHVSNHCLFCTTDYWDVASLSVRTATTGPLLVVPSFRFGHTTKIFPIR